MGLALWVMPLRVMAGLPHPAFPLAGDVAQHVLGQRYFLGEPWARPWLVARGLAWPAGTNIAFMDSIPLEALPLKMVRGWLPPGFEGVHAWLALCVVLQPVAAVFALRGTGERRVLPAMAVAMVAASMPVFWFRFIHIALASHFLLLAALGLYLRLCRGARWGVWLAASALPVLALLVHPYLFVMVAALLGAAPLSLLLRRDPAWLRAGLAVGCGLALALAAVWALGYRDAQPSAGFGAFSMNALAPVAPSLSGLFPDLLVIARPGQRDGYNYLGLGGLALLAGLAVWGRGLLRRHAGLALACLCLTALALSNQAFAGRTMLWSLGEPPAWLAQFRGTGRLFWPVAYAAVVAGCAVLARRPRYGGALLALVALAQFADASRLRSHAWQMERERPAWAVDPAVARALLARSSLLGIRPEFGCGGRYGEDARFEQLAQLAAERLVPIDSAYAARLARMPDCAAGLVRPLRPGELRVFVEDAAQLAPSLPGAGQWCRAHGGMTWCTADPASLAVLESAALAALPAAPLGAALPVLPADPAVALLEGWCPSDGGGAWSCAPEAELAVRAAGGVRHLALRGQALGLAPGQAQTVRVTVDGRDVARVPFPDLAVADMQLALPQEARGLVRIGFRMEGLTSPAARGINGDARQLGVWLSSVALLP